MLRIIKGFNHNTRGGNNHFAVEFSHLPIKSLLRYTNEYIKSMANLFPRNIFLTEFSEACSLIVANSVVSQLKLVINGKFSTIKRGMLQMSRQDQTSHALRKFTMLNS